jgi:hypothetical protein
MAVLREEGCGVPFSSTLFANIVSAIVKRNKFIYLEI